MSSAAANLSRCPLHRIVSMMTLAGLLGLSLAFPFQGTAAEENPKPNIILMMADDLGYGDPGFNGGQIIRTPHLDEMARSGMRMTRFYAGAPVCSPTRGSCLTGRHPFRYGIFFANVGHLPPVELTLAELLKTQGYVTGHFGKWHLGTLTKTERDANRGGEQGAEHYSPPWDNGFDTCFSTESKVPTWDPLLVPRGKKTGSWWDPLEPGEAGAPYGTAYWSNGNRVTDQLRGDDSRIIMDRAVPFVREAIRSGRPFFAVIWFHAPHLPVVAGPQYTALYSQYSKFQQHYYGCVTALDEQAGRLRRELRELNVADNTLLFFASDNGPEGGPGDPGSAGPLRGRKRSLFEGGVRVPGLVEWPARIKPGGTSDLAASTCDYLPTILEILGVELADARPLDGVSLVGLFEGRLAERPRPLGFESAGQVALVDNGYKLIHVPAGKADAAEGEGNSESGEGQDPAVAANKAGKGKKKEQVQQSLTYMLFDLLADPGESRDLAAEHPQIVERMAKQLDAWRESCRQSLAGKDYPAP